ncbi:C1q-like domain-containing protein [Archangium lansingense]|uniref:C1q-like domain-containing protein n=1 Tax=Archangium lansingense TaxID=2995310 RepID=UPI003B78F7B9
MKTSRVLLLSGLVSFLAPGFAWAEEPAAAGREAGPPKERVLFAQYKTVDPTTARQAELSTGTRCPESGIVAFSASGSGHVSEGGLMLLSYPTTHTQEGSGWAAGGGTFVAPCTGLYFFNISFVKDAYHYGATANDVFVHILKNGANKGRALSGQGHVDRDTGVYSVTLFLAQGDYVQTFASSDGRLKRHLLEYNFTGHLVKQAAQGL